MTQPEIDLLLQQTLNARNQAEFDKGQALSNYQAAQAAFVAAEAAYNAALALVADPPVTFNLTAINNWLTNGVDASADVTLCLLDSSNVFHQAPSAAGSLNQLLEHAFGPGQVHGATYDAPNNQLLFNSDAPINKFGVVHSGGSVTVLVSRS